ncbi:MAG: SH3 domain-containing protein [Chloroflexi bacterium]|nr:SH3 domain-containing protein [Chloroflexota bacterium]MCC6893335.1 SH3 domain-containing protein [Anaerolineae bacterium]
MHNTRSGRSITLLLMVLLAGVISGCNLASTPGQDTAIISGPPTVQIATPLANATYLTNVAVNIQALIGNAGADIDRIEILVDGTIIETLPTPNPGGAPSFSIAQSWQAAGEGQHTISVTAFRADGSSSAPASVTINVITEQPSPTTAPTQTTGSTAQPTASTGNTARPTTRSDGGDTPATDAPAPTNAEPAAPAASATPSAPYTTTTQGINVRKGPNILFDPPIGSLAANQSVELLARSTDGQWFKVKYYNGSGWVFAAFTTPSVDPSTLTVDPGPPVPTPVPPTPTLVPVVPTAVPAATTANLVIGNVNISPAMPIACGKTVEIAIDVANLGGQPTTTNGSISIRDVRTSDGTETASTTGAFGPINNGQTVNIRGIFLTVTTYVGEDHKLIITVNPGGAVPETGSGDNTREIAYNLQGGC